MTAPSHPLHDGSLDPLALLRRSRGDNDLRDIKLRLLWLRQQEPEARLRTKLVSLDERGVVMTARIELPGGGAASAHAASPVGEAGIDRIVAETELRALGSALDALGYVVVDAAAHPAEDTPEPAASPPAPESPRRQPPGHVQAIRALRDREQQVGPVAPDPIMEEAERPAPVEPTPSRAPQRGPAAVERHPASIETAPVDLAERRRPAAPEPEAEPPADDDADPELEDISWTAFWTWARNTYQIGSRGQVEELLGTAVDRKNPGELRRLLIEHFDGTPDDGR